MSRFSDPTAGLAADQPPGGLLRGQRVALVGKLAGMPRREAQRLVRQQGGVIVEPREASATLIVVGEWDLPVGDLGGDELGLDDAVRQAIDAGQTSILTESQLWERLNLVEAQQNIRRLYTPAMLADLLGVPVAVIRRWNRKGLIVPAREVQRLPYFDFQEVATAQRLAQLLAAGCSPQSIERKLRELARHLPTVRRPLAQLSIIVQGKQILLRQGDGLVEPGGQLRFDFTDEAAAVTGGERPNTQVCPATHDAERGRESQADSDDDDVIPIHRSGTAIDPGEMRRLAVELEDAGELETAAEMYRALLAAEGPDAELNFALAEVLYRQHDLPAARERYYMAIELDEDYVEARANLGCVLEETGQAELAVAAFQGALAHHSEYPDVHYHLARTLDRLDRRDEAERHWRTFLELTANSPWRETAQHRLGIAPAETGSRPEA